MQPRPGTVWHEPWLSGIGVSRHADRTRAEMHGGDLEVPEYTLAPEEIEQEVTRFHGTNAAHAISRVQYDSKSRRDAGRDRAFIDTHLLMMEDRSLTVAVVALIREHGINAEAALRRQRDALVSVFEQMDDPYLRTRKDDGSRRRACPAHPAEERTPDLAEAGRCRTLIMVADDITPADIILLSHQNVAAFITEYGGPLSHTAIWRAAWAFQPSLACAMRASCCARTKTSSDGEAGHVLADPDAKASGFLPAQAGDPGPVSP